jgi:hypothetical protein
MPIRSFALVVVLALASALGAARADDGVHAVGRVRPVAPGPTASVAATTGYGFTEELFGAGDAHHRALGALAVAVQPTRWLEVVGLVVGRYDRHTGGPGDDGWVGDPRVTATIAHHGASRSLGLRLGLWLPGADAPSIEPSAATVEASAVASPHGAIGLTASAGLRLDRSTETVDAAMLSPADRVGLGYSDADAILVGLGARHRRGPWTVLGEASAELLFGDDAPAMSQSPWRLGVGARRDLNRSLTVEALVEVGGSSRPSFAELPADRLIAIEPRLAIGLGLSWRPAPAAPRPVVVAPPPIDTPPPVDEPPPPTTGPIAGRVTDATGSPVPDATVTVGERRATTGEDGTFTIPEVALGDATVTIERSGFEPATQAVAVTAGAGARVDVVLARVKLPSQIKGLVRDFGGKGLAATIAIAPIGATITAGADGSFVVDVPPGTYRVTVSLAGYRTQDKTVVVEDSGVAFLNIDLQKVRR